MSIKIVFPTPVRVTDIMQSLSLPIDTIAMEVSLTAATGFDSATRDYLSFARPGMSAADLLGCPAGACLVHPNQEPSLGTDCVAIPSLYPEADFYRFIEPFHPKYPVLPPVANHQTTSSFIDPTATLGHNVRCGHSVVILGGAKIGDNVTIGHFSIIGNDVSIGNNCHIGHHVMIEHTEIGDNAIIGSGAKVGSTGFGYITRDGMKPIRRPHLGKVIISDDVEIGAETTVDRGSLKHTKIGEGTKIDSQVVIAHNVTIGKHCIIVAQTGIAGSSTLGNRCVLGGQVGVADHVNIGAGSSVLAKSGVISHIEPGKKMAGYPAKEARIFWRAVAHFYSGIKRKKT